MNYDDDYINPRSMISENSLKVIGPTDSQSSSSSIYDDINNLPTSIIKRNSNRETHVNNTDDIKNPNFDRTDFKQLERNEDQIYQDWQKKKTEKTEKKKKIIKKIVIILIIILLAVGIILLLDYYNIISIGIFNKSSKFINNISGFSNTYIEKII